VRCLPRGARFADLCTGSGCIAVSTLCMRRDTSAVAVDLIPAVRKKETEPKTQMLLTRILCLAFVACSFIFATQNTPIIVSLMSFSWGIVSGCFIGPYIWGLFSKKITKIGAHAGIIAGFLTVGGATLVISLNSGFSAAAVKSPRDGRLRNGSILCSRSLSKPYYKE